eukprot:1141581-Pelagomonas_calceolata.AAC.2
MFEYCLLSDHEVVRMGAQKEVLLYIAGLHGALRICKLMSFLSSSRAVRLRRQTALLVVQ